MGLTGSLVYGRYLLLRDREVIVGVIGQKSVSGGKVKVFF